MARFQNPSPSFPFLADIFGQGYTYNRRGGFKLTGEQTGEGLFGGGAQDAIGNFLNLTGDNAFTTALGDIGRTGNFAGLPEEYRLPYQQATGTLDELIGTSRPVVNALIEHGMPVDVSGVVSSRYRNTILPSAAEQYNPASGTAFGNIAAREAANLIAELEYPAQEAARERQLQALTVASPTLASLATSRLALPNAVLNDLASAGQTTDAGGRLLSALLSLLGSTQQQSELVRTGSAVGTPGGQSGTAELISGIANPLGSILGCWVADELFGPTDVRTLFARAWCFAHPDHPFVRRYMRDGRGWAAWLRAHPEWKRVVAPTWEWMARAGAALFARTIH
jgi:hypothetical protein